MLLLRARTSGFRATGQGKVVRQRYRINRPELRGHRVVR